MAGCYDCYDLPPSLARQSRMLAVLYCRYDAEVAAVRALIERGVVELVTGARSSAEVKVGRTAKLQCACP